jgi:cell division septation protein DedD
MESNVPATTQEPALPATTQEPAIPATVDQTASQSPPPRPRQNVTTGLFPLALGVLVLTFLALALWTLMTVTPSGV